MTTKTVYEIAKEDLRKSKARLTQFNKEKLPGMSGMQARLRRGREIEIRQSIKYAQEALNAAMPKTPKCNFTLEELKWLGYKNKAEYLRKHTKQ